MTFVLKSSALRLNSITPATPNQFLMCILRNIHTHTHIYTRIKFSKAYWTPTATHFRKFQIYFNEKLRTVKNNWNNPVFCSFRTQITPPTLSNSCCILQVLANICHLPRKPKVSVIILQIKILQVSRNLLIFVA